MYVNPSIQQDNIRSCITLSANNLKQLREQRQANPDDIDTDSKFKAEQRKVIKKLLTN